MHKGHSIRDHTSCTTQRTGDIEQEGTVVYIGGNPRPPLSEGCPP